MKNPSSTKTISAVIILIMVGIFGWLVIRNKLAVTPVNIAPPVSQVAISDAVDKNISETKELYEISIHYPYYNNPGIDTEIKKYIDGVYNEFTKSFESPDEVITLMFGGDNKGFLTISYDIKKSAQMSSIVFRGAQYTGGAHPTPFIFTVHIGSDGTLLSMADIFMVPGSEYFTVLSKYVSDQLSKEFGDGFFKEGADSNPENWNHWYIDNDNLIVLFSAYQVASYVNGEPEVIVPFSVIKNIAKPEYFK